MKPKKAILAFLSSLVLIGIAAFALYRPFSPDDILALPSMRGAELNELATGTMHGSEVYFVPGDVSSVRKALMDDLRARYANIETVDHDWDDAIFVFPQPDLRLILVVRADSRQRTTVELQCQYAQVSGTFPHRHYSWR